MKAIVDTGVNVIVAGGKVADLALHYANKYKVMVVRLNSKWDLRRLCKTVNATALPRLVSLYRQILFIRDNTLNVFLGIFIYFTHLPHLNHLTPLQLLVSGDFKSGQFRSVTPLKFQLLLIEGVIITPRSRCIVHINPTPFKCALFNNMCSSTGCPNTGRNWSLQHGEAG